MVRTRIGGKYFGDQPERSMETLGLWAATDSASFYHENEGEDDPSFRGWCGDLEHPSSPRQRNHSA